MHKHTNSKKKNKEMPFTFWAGCPKWYPPCHNIHFTKSRAIDAEKEPQYNKTTTTKLSSQILRVSYMSPFLPSSFHNSHLLNKINNHYILFNCLHPCLFQRNSSPCCSINYDAITFLIGAYWTSMHISHSILSFIPNKSSL